MKPLKPGLPGHARRYSPSEITQVLEYANKHGIATATRDLGACKETIARWKRPVAAAAQRHGDDLTSGPMRVSRSR